jgi:micrococcal nuclease
LPALYAKAMTKGLSIRAISKTLTLIKFSSRPGLLISLLGAIALIAQLSPQSVQQVFSLFQSDALGQSKHYTVVPEAFHDGDSFTVKDGSREIKVVLCGLDAPELEQALGTQARDRLRGLIAQGEGRISLVATGVDKHGRTIADAFIQTGNEQEIHVNSQMLSDGMAYVYPELVDGCPNAAVMKKAERTAKTDTTGVWANPTALRPWDYR